MIKKKGNSCDILCQKRKEGILMIAIKKRSSLFLKSRF
ncbi:hypothetical protein PORCRE_1738 [Porphyromonas crevioricanis JCM 15906]|uniref:Uncharacterized protein n=1 Tax=Porphyromonas crevioricanis JCM 15906 TaxID=1305617 RepID=T1CSB2_9PORP|nr:hypothetical protein PORCRE_1738 [Porphyromonas crevioricanis JCM 15906]